MVPTHGSTDRANLGVGYVMAFLAIEDILFEPYKRIGERLYFLFGLTQKMQNQTQSCSAPYSGKRCHLVNGLL
jgi:hypothetical protein